MTGRREARPLLGRIQVVSDKSLTHRGVILGALAEGTTVLERPNLGQDCRATLAAVKLLGARVEETPEAWTVHGSRARLREPERVLDLENSGTGLRLLCGVVAGVSGMSILTGDESLRRRPMQRLIDPLVRMGARIDARVGGYAPLVVQGSALHAVDWKSEVASAQVKSAILLAGLFVEDGPVRVAEPALSRDHTERLLEFLGVSVVRGPRTVTLPPGARLGARSWRVPGDPSAAAFFAVAALLVPGSDLVIEDLGMNPTRCGAFSVLERMGAPISRQEIETIGPEPVGTLGVRYGRLRATVVEGDEIPSLIDEIPILAVAAAGAEGTTVFHGIGELRVKESDRLASTAALLRILGVSVEMGPDWLAVHGSSAWQGGRVSTQRDHRIAMAAKVAGLVTRSELLLDDASMIATSDPLFEASLDRLSGGMR